MKTNQMHSRQCEDGQTDDVIPNMFEFCKYFIFTQFFILQKFHMALSGTVRVIIFS